MVQSSKYPYSRKTVAKALAHPVPPGYRLREPRRQPVLDDFKPVIDAWLEQDASQPPKQRHTAQRMYERLRDEHGFKGHPATVRRYVSKARASGKEVYMPLAFGPGEEAQVDWHEGWVIESGRMRKAQFFCMRLCQSKASFVWPYERATLESFLDGHVRAFEFFGGVPRRLAYDYVAGHIIDLMWPTRLCNRVSSERRQQGKRASTGAHNELQCIQPRQQCFVILPDWPSAGARRSIPFGFASPDGCLLGA